VSQSASPPEPQLVAQPVRGYRRFHVAANGALLTVNTHTLTEGPDHPAMSYSMTVPHSSTSASQSVPPSGLDARA
jgi:hypothetical protein